MSTHQTFAQQIRNEFKQAKPGSDDGMLPMYSILGDWIENASDEPLVEDALKRVHGVIDALLDEAQPLDEHTLACVSTLLDWIGEGDTLPAEAMPELPAATSAASAQADVSDEEDLSSLDTLMVIDLQDDTEVLDEFYTEANEHLQQIETVLLDLEGQPDNPDALASLFRSFHTIKGVAGFLNLKPIQSLAHEIEFLLDKARNGELLLSSGTITLILGSKDTLNALVTQVSEALSEGKAPAEVIKISHLVKDARKAIAGEFIEVAKDEKPAQAAPKASVPDVAKPKSKEPALPAPAASAKAGKNLATSSSIRVNTTKLDSLLDTVGELVITQSQLMESAKHLTDKDSMHVKHLNQLTRISKELQHTSMSLRMVPIAATFQKMGRIVRDVSTKLSKRVNFKISGEETELDRGIVELIGDPLVHMVRNAVDHGVETPEERRKSGKAETGTVELKAYHMGGNIIIDLKDDGKGLNPDILLQKVIDKGLVPEDQHFTDQEIYQFIFLPGFSTAKEVTDVSGRGVGMDVVRRNIESLRGTVTIDSELGLGSLFRIKLPLTTAIIDGLLVRVGRDRFIVPTLSVKVTLRPERHQIKRMQGGAEILDLRGQTIPILRLHHAFGISGATTDPQDSILIIIETMGRPIALMVDELLGKQEVVIKSLGEAMRKLPGVAGGAILGDGTVALILDPAGLDKEKPKTLAHANAA